MPAQTLPTLHPLPLCCNCPFKSVSVHHLSRLALQELSSNVPAVRYLEPVGWGLEKPVVKREVEKFMRMDLGVSMMIKDGGKCASSFWCY